MEGTFHSIENALVSWINTFPNLPQVVQSFDDLFDGLIFSCILNQIDPGFPLPSVLDPSHVSTEESIQLFDTIKTYLKSDIVDEEATVSEEQVLDSNSIVFDHNKDEVLYLIKIILGIAMQCPQKNLFLMRITELPGEIRDILSPIAEEVLATMQVPEEYVDDEHLKSFEEMMEEVGSEENEDDWGDWNDTETPVDTFSPTDPLDDTSKLLEEREDAIYSLKEELLHLKQLYEDLESENQKKVAENQQLCIQQEQLNQALAESKTHILQLQMKLDESATPAVEPSLLSAETIRTELEKVEQENVELEAKLAGMTREMNELKESYEKELEASKNQISLLKVENQQMQKIDQLNQVLKKQLAEYKRLENTTPQQPTLPESSALEKKMNSLVEDNKQYQTKVIQYQQEVEQLLTTVEQLKRTIAQYERDIEQLTQKNESLQLLVSSPGEEDVHKESSFSGLDQLLSERSSMLDIKKTKEYMEQSNELLLANEKILSLNKKVEELKVESIELRKQLVQQSEETQKMVSPSETESIPAEQYALLVTKLELKDDEMKVLREDLETAKGERDYGFRKLEVLQNDNEELTANLKKSYEEIKKLETVAEKLKHNFRQSLTKLKQDELDMKEYEKQLEEEKQRSAQQYDYLKKQEEVMFTAIHKLGSSTMMKYYKSNLQMYRPKGWLARVRISQAKLF